MTLKKTLFCLVGVLGFFVSSAKADFNDLVLDKAKETTEKLGLSKAFLRALETCSPIKETRTEMGIDVTYEVKGYDEQGNCLMENSSEMQGFSAVSACTFDKETLQEFLRAQQKIRTLIETATSLQDILSNEDYLAASGMMMDEKICTNKHSEVDQSKELRRHLKDCTPYEQTMSLLDRGSVSLKIFGREGEKCHFMHKMLMKAPSAQEVKKIWGDEMYEKIKDTLKDMELVTDCKFGEATKEKYIRLLEQTVIPAGDTLDIDMIQEKREVQKKVSDFLSNTPECTTSQN